MNGFYWQSHGSSMRYVKNGIVLARYWPNEDETQWQIAISLPLQGGFRARFTSADAARKMIETKVSEWLEQINV